MIPRRFRSPLFGTALVLAALGVVSIPLHRLTAHADKPAAAPDARPDTGSDVTGAILRIRVIDAVHGIAIRTTQQRVLFQADVLEPGEVEQDVEIKLEKESLELQVDANAGDKETAVFVTLLPDGREERTAYAIGSGSIGETLRFQWSTTHE